MVYYNTTVYGGGGKSMVNPVTCIFSFLWSTLFLPRLYFYTLSQRLIARRIMELWISTEVKTMLNNMHFICGQNPSVIKWIWYIFKELCIIFLGDLPTSPLRTPTSPFRRRMSYDEEPVHGKEGWAFNQSHCFQI